jgi:hypothetical protein
VRWSAGPTCLLLLAAHPPTTTTTARSFNDQMNAEQHVTEALNALQKVSVSA